MKADGYNVVTVAPVDNESGEGGRALYSTEGTLSIPSEYDIIPAGSPSLGRDPDDPDIWYYNGTPAACTFVALDYVIPNYYNNMTIDLYGGGPNYGGNLGPFLYTLSGTFGGTYAAIGRGIPGIAFSGGNSEQRSYTYINTTTPSGYPDPATIQGQLAANIVSQIINATKPGDPILPPGYGVSVNTPTITSLTNDSCVNPPFIQTRMTGGAFIDSAIYNETTGTFSYGNVLDAALNACINGDCSLPGEQAILDSGCMSSVTVFTTDYDAPTGSAQTWIRAALEPLVPYQNSRMGMVLKERDSRSKREIEESSPLRHE